MMINDTFSVYTHHAHNRELAEELGLDAPPSSTFTKSNSKGGGSSFFATILQRLSYSMEPEESGGSSSKGGGESFVVGISRLALLLLGPCVWVCWRVWSTRPAHCFCSG